MAAQSRQAQINQVLLKFYQNPVAKISIELFLSFGLVFALAIFSIRPTLIIMSDLTKEIEDKKAYNEALEKKVAALSTARTEYDKVVNRLRTVEEAVPSSPSIAENLKIVEKTAADSSVIIQSIALSEVPDELEEPSNAESQNVDALTNLPVTISVIGDYASIKQFVETLQNNRRAVDIDSITFKLSQDRNKSELNAKIAMYFLYFGETE